MIRALIWLLYLLLIGYAFVSMSLAARFWGRRLALALAASAAIVLATYYLATH